MEIVGEVIKEKDCCGNCLHYLKRSMAGEPSHGVCRGPHVGESRFFDKKIGGIFDVTKPIVNYGTHCLHHARRPNT